MRRVQIALMYSEKALAPLVSDCAFQISRERPTAGRASNLLHDYYKKGDRNVAKFVLGIAYAWEQPVTNFQRVRTRRQLLRVTAIGAATIPLLALPTRSESAQNQGGNNQGGSNQGGNNQGGNNHSCFLKGTKISTPTGDRLVQELRIGDEVQTLAGRKPIKWIGYNRFTKEEGRAWQDSVMPIHMARFAIDNATPYRDLYLSPLHCVFFNDALVPVMYLVNETSIAQGTPSEMSALEYYHVELDTHEVIYAEGASVESFDGSNRDNFSNFMEYERLYGAERRSKMTPFAPILRYHGRRHELNGLVRSLISNVVDVRDPIQISYDQLAQRAEALLV